MKKQGLGRHTAPITLILILLANPNVHVIDVLPDFIAYIIAACMLTYAKDRAPYFEEARSGFIKLAIVSALKIPAYFVITYTRAGNVQDYDIRALFAFSFGVAELWLSLILIGNLYSALVYLGERSASSAAIKPFPVSRGGRLGTLEGLRLFTTVFVIVKCAGYALPELLVLTRIVSSGSGAFNYARLYPYTIVILIPLILALGIAWAVRCRKYCRSVAAAEDFRTSLDSLFDECGREALNKRLWLASLKSSLSVMLVSTFFTVEIVFDNFKSINIIPHFVFGLILTLGALRLGKFVGGARWATVSGILYSAVSVVYYVFYAGFLSEHGYDALATSKIAASDYRAVIITAIAEAVALIVFFVLLGTTLRRLAYAHTGTSPESDRYMRSDREYHARINKKTLVWCALGSALAILRCVDVLIKSKMSIIHVFIESDTVVGGTTGSVAESAVPWFGTLILAATAIFVVYSLYYFAYLKSECDLKYAYN